MVAESRGDVYASVDLGGTKLAGAVAGDDGGMLAEREIPTQSHLGPEGVIERIAQLVEGLAGVAGRRPSALGIGIPGLADLSRGAVRFLPNLPTQWRDVPLRDLLMPQVGGVPVYLLNDARMATLGELVFGQGQGVSTMAFYTLGTGIGGGVVVDGKLRLGPLGAAGELGHQTILPDGPRCGCGNTGCLETLASGPAITAQGVWLLESGRAPHLHGLVHGDAGLVTPAVMVEAASLGDESVLEALTRACTYIGIGVVNVIVTLHPELIVLGGGVSQIGDLLFDTVRDVVKRRVGMFPPDGVRVEPSALGHKAGLYGGIALAARAGQV